ncbi:hypothetical protein SKAU_G00331610 [Synaphobranchus kaupii]|uniref:Mannosidase endo-alpha like n=1 Tax=Synaphobranchus kaupii TaxID=118154 RepID=A0A9Q1ELE8_SYNKA|nr:hypothetical protein SKAU_G00331610 [Synaphobranchus kaupii]
MARLRKKACVALFLFTLFIFGTMMGLRTLKPSDGFNDLAPGLDLMPMVVGERVDRRSVSSNVVVSPGQARAAGNTKVVFSNSGPGDGSIFYDVHIFYYVWYGNPQMDGKYMHWDHVLVPHWDPKIAASYPKGRHTPPEDIGSSFYPELGPYSSRDPDVLESHMEQLGAAAAGVLVLSWYPPGLADDNGEPTEDLVPAILDSAHRHSIKVAFHLQPYKGRSDHSVHENIKYIIDKYGKHGAFYRFKSSAGKVLPLFYIYDSYLTAPEAWSDLLTSTGSHTLRGDALRRRLHRPDRGGATQARHPGERLRRHVHLLRLQRLLLRLLAPELESHQGFLRRQQPAVRPQRRAGLHRHQRSALEQPQHAQQGERALLRDRPTGGAHGPARDRHHHLLQRMARGYADRAGRAQEDGDPAFTWTTSPTSPTSTCSSPASGRSSSTRRRSSG